LVREEEAFELGVIDSFKVVFGHADVAVPAAIGKRLPGRDVHLLLAGRAEGEAGEEVGRRAAQGFATGPLALQDRVTSLPEFHRDDGFDFVDNPFALGLVFDGAGLDAGGGVVLPVLALGRRIPQQPVYGGVRPGFAGGRLVSSLVEDARHGLLAAGLGKQLVHELSDRRLVGVRDDLAILAHISERHLAGEGFAELGADGDRRFDARRDLFPFPLREGGLDRVEHEAGGRARIDGVFERDEVCAVRLEGIGELQEFARVPGQARELGKDKRLDVPGLDARNHALGFRVFGDGFAAHASEVIDLAHVPTLGLRVQPGARFVMRGAVSLRLVFG